MLLRTHHQKSIGVLLSENMMLCILILLGMGLFMVMDATAPKNVNQGTISLQVMKQLSWDVLGLVCFGGIIMLIPVKLIKSSSFWIGLLSIALLAAVLVVGVEIKGARRWFRIGSLGFQPSELAKVGGILFFGWYLDKYKDAVSSWFGMLRCMMLILLMIGLIAIEPDLGNAALLFAVLVGMLFIAGAKLSHLISLLMITLPLFIYGMYTKFDHVKKRIMVYLNPEDHINDGFYQGNQALIALGSGGWNGKGIGMGLQKLYYLPEAHNDFIFAIIGEDLGFIGCAAVVSVYGLLVWYAIQVCFRCADLFSLLVSFGITCLFAGQALFNISVVTALVPNKGISLPLISYGGSNALFTLIGLGILVKLTRGLPPDCPRGLGAIRNSPKKVPLF